MESLLIFFHKVHGELVKWLCFWGHWGTSEMFWEAHRFFYYCEFWFFYKQRFFYSHYVFKGAKLAKFIRLEAGWKLGVFYITKFTEMGWNDCVFERTEEHQRCSGKCTDFFLTQRFFYILYVFKGAKLAKFIRYEVVWKLCLFFYHKVHGVRVKWLCFWALEGTSEMFWEWNRKIVKSWRC